MLVKTRFTVLSLCVIVALLLGAWQPVLAQETPAEPAAASSVVPAPYVPRDDAPPYGLRGPHPVGVRDLVIEPATTDGRPIPVTIWYPALNPDELPEVTEYVLDYGNPNFPDFAVAGRALRDAAPDVAGGPYPLVVHSHGLWQFRQASAWLMEQLASHGFVVVAGDHDDNWGDIMGEPAGDNYVVRPQEITQVIDFAETLGAEGEFAGMIDMEHVGVTGHSYGAETALLAGGARLNTDHFLNEWCAANPGDPADPLNDCAGIPPLLDKMATMAGLEEVPTGPWPDWSDPRVDAVVPLFAGPQYFGPEGLAALHVPVLLAESELDLFYSAANAYYRPYTLLPEANKTHVYYENGDHMLFANECGAMPGLVAQGLGWFCWDAVWDTGRAKDLASHFVTAFLLAELKGDAEAAAALAPENVSFPGIQYESTEFGSAATAASPNLDDAITAQIEAMVEQMMADTGTPGYALGIVKDGQIVYTKGFGVERVGEDKPVTEHTVFGTGCVGKPAVATAIMQLVDAGKIDLDAPVTDYLPYFKLADERYKEITVRQLITNRSGLPDVEDWFSPPVEYDDGVLERYVRSLDNTKLLFAPGQRWYYTGMGYIVLADVIQKVTGQTFEDYLQQHILDPLGMEDTLLIVGEADQAHVAGNHVHDNAGELVISDIFPYRRQYTAAAPLFSSISDLARYALAHLNRGELDGQRILPAADYDAMWEPISAMNSPLFPALQAHYGMGWFVGALDGHRAVGHFGADEGYAALMLLTPDDNTGLVLASNFFDWDEFDIRGWETGIDIMKMLLGSEPEAEAAGSN